MKELTVIAIKGQRIITTELLAEKYETESRRITENFNRNESRFIEGKHYYLLQGKELQDFKNQYALSVAKYTSKLYVWTYEGILIHLEIANIEFNSKIDFISEYFGVCKDNIKRISLVRKETNFLDMLEKVLEPFCYKTKRQYSVLGYRIDLYIESLNVAIEYDENDHKKYSYEQQEGRQKEIETKLNCKFIRVSDKESDLYNIGLIIKEMFLP